MAGLFDFLSNEDPNQAAQLAMAAGLLGGRGSFNEIVGKSLLAGQAEGQRAGAIKRQAQLDALAKQRFQLALDEEQRKKQAYDAQEKFRRSIQSPDVLAAQTAMAGGGGPTLANAANMPPVSPDERLMHGALQAGAMTPMEYLASRRKDTTPIKGSPGDVFFQPGTFKKLAEVAPKPEATPAAIQEYQMAQGQGYTGSLNDFLLQRARAGASTTEVKVNSFLPASEEAQRDFMKGIRSRYDQLQSAPAMLQNIDKAKALAQTPNAFVGSFGDKKMAVAQFFNNNFGTSIAPQSIQNAAELQSRLFVQVMENLKKMDAQPSQYQQQVMQDAFGKLTTDPAAIPKVLDVFGDIVRQKVSIHNKEVKSSLDRGVKYPYDPLISLPAKSVSWGELP